jgi:spermidine/putrescine transport system permease protein
MTTATAPRTAPGPGMRQRLARALPYLLLGPGLIYLAIFYVVPAIQMFTYSISTGNLETGYTITWSLDAYAEGLERYGKQFLNSILYGGAATLLTLFIGFPVAYTIAFRGRPAQEPAAVPRDRPVLHELPDPDHQLEDPAG